MKTKKNTKKRFASISMVTALILGLSFNTAAYAEDKAVEIAWAKTSSSTSNAIFLDVDAITPGSKGESSITVTNKGPDVGKLVAKIVDVQVNNTPISSRIIEDKRSTLSQYLSDLTINSKSVESLIGKETVVFDDKIAKDASKKISFDYLLPESSISGNAFDIGETKVSFKVNVSISGDTPEVPKDKDKDKDEDDDKTKPKDDNGPKDKKPKPKPKDDDKTKIDEDGSDKSKDKDGLPVTGADIMFYALLGISATLIGVVLIGIVRRKKDEDQVTPE